LYLVSYKPESIERGGKVVVAFGSYEELQPMFTEPGLLKLAQIVKQARKERSYRDFEEITGISHTTIRRLELTEVKNPDVATLSKLAPHTPYCVEELVSIAGENHKAEIREYRTAEEAMAVVGQLSKQEAARLAQMIIGRLAKMDAVVQNDPPNDGLFLQIRLMDQEQMAEVLRAIADRMSPPSTDGDGGSASRVENEMPSSADNGNGSAE
jgi:transcriptional regulator with XRE-family HTH domain